MKGGLLLPNNNALVKHQIATAAYAITGFLIAAEADSILCYQIEYYYHQPDRPEPDLDTLDRRIGIVFSQKLYPFGGVQKVFRCSGVHPKIGNLSKLKSGPQGPGNGPGGLCHIQR